MSRVPWGSESVFVTQAVTAWLTATHHNIHTPAEVGVLLLDAEESKVG